MRWRGIFISTGCIFAGLSTLGIGSGLVNWPSTVAQSQREKGPDAIWRREPVRRFDLQVVIGGRTLPEYYSHGRVYIEAEEGAEYELRLHNPLPRRVAVALSVDGLNTIDARHTTAWNASKWVIEPYGTITISGWQMSSERARHFYFTNERDSYAAKLGQTTNLGVISAVFFSERQVRPVPITPPRQNEKEDAKTESSAPSIDSRGASAMRRDAPSDDYAATGIGRSMRHDVWWVDMDLEKQPAAEVTIRYEYYWALRKLGVFPRSPYPEPDPLNRRGQSRGFSPEP
jgi:hypothetical protein